MISIKNFPMGLIPVAIYMYLKPETLKEVSKLLIYIEVKKMKFLELISPNRVMREEKLTCLLSNQTRRE